jgi:hypothetical protein
MTEIQICVRKLPDTTTIKKIKKDLFFKLGVNHVGSDNCINDFHQVFTETQYNEHEGAIVSNTEER